MKKTETRKYRSFFWPILLIGVGTVWLLHNLGYVDQLNLGLLLRMWPIILIVIGVDWILGRRIPVLAALIDVFAATFMILAMLFAPSFNLNPNTEIRSASFQEPIAGTSSAQINLRSSVGETQVQALRDSAQLMTADIRSLGLVDFDVSGESHKSLTLQPAQRTTFNVLDLVDSVDDLYWRIGLSPQVPLDLAIRTNVGRSDLDLKELDLRSLDVRGDVGHVSLTLPASTQAYEANIRGDVGAFEISVESGAKLKLDIDGGVGDFDIEFNEKSDIEAYIQGDVGAFTIDIPRETGVLLEGDIDIGSISVPSSMVQIQYDDKESPGSKGIWQSTNYETADYKIKLVFRGNVGGLTLE